MRRHVFLTATAFWLALNFMESRAAIGEWKIYLSYSQVQNIEEAGSNYLFVRASNSIYLYDKDDGSITTFDKTSGLNDVSVSHIAWNSTAKRLVVVYDNSNIDLVDTDCNVTNVSDLYNKTMTEDKTVNSITIYGKYAFLATNFGAVKVNVADAEISESYLLGITAKKVGISDGNIYIKQSNNQVLMASLSASNLQDYSFWSSTSSYPDGIFDEDKTAYNDNIDLVNTLNPGGPKNNNMGFLKLKNGTLYTCNGTWGNIDIGSFQSMTDGEWTFHGDSAEINSITGQRYADFICLDVDPTNEKRVMIGAINGMYEFIDGEFSQFFNSDNSAIESYNSSSYNHQLVTAIHIDDDGNTWCFNSQAPTKSLLKYTSDGEWEDYSKDEFIESRTGKSIEDVRNMVVDSRGLLWFGNMNYKTPSLFHYNIETDELTAYTDYINQDGTELSVSSINDIAEDKDGNVWFGANNLLAYVSDDDIPSGDDIVYQHKVARDDGSGLADYLFDGTAVQTIAVDGANRKWIGTIGDGLYLISADNNEQIYHFTKSNSKLLSDDILDLEYDSSTGVLYIGSESGLCSYETDATEPTEEMTSDNVYAYPNPVSPDYTGLITVLGLTDNADVKITTATGYLVYEGRSNGGTFTWDGKDKKGNRVASGVYNVLTAKSDGSKGTVCKIVIIR